MLQLSEVRKKGHDKNFIKVLIKKIWFELFNLKKKNTFFSFYSLLSPTTSTTAKTNHKKNAKSLTFASHTILLNLSSFVGRFASLTCYPT